MKRARAAVAAAALFGIVLVSGPAEAASPYGRDEVTPYGTAPDAKPVTGTASSTEGPRLRPGTYTDTISAGEKKFYRVVLDAESNAYVSTVLAPPPGSRVGSADGVRIVLESTDGAMCSVSNDVTFGGGTARPIADYATRRIGRGRECQSAGDYLYSVEWIGSADTSGARSWPVEIKYMTEPGLQAGAVVPSAPSSWSSPAPVPVVGAAKGISGGTGFNDAPAVGRGVWKDELGPGESRFYRVPVDWGQRLFLDAEFANSTTGQPEAVAGGLRLSLFNTARGFVESADSTYLGKPATVSLRTAPAAFAHRTSAQDDTAAMRFSGWYYVRVSLDQRVGSTLPMTLHVGVEGEPQQGPAYDGDAVAAGFGIPDGDHEAGGGRDALLTAVGLAGIGIGTVLVLVLAAWTALARRGGRVPAMPSARDELVAAGEE
ncbi:hypothetical protein [Streptomyces sp. NPDC020681]|uniref:hypothetical protein n=1 Tax=Streptomyces sp. NPDC020681 TaxID=3365083 RepID=UPI0037BD00D3